METHNKVAQVFVAIGSLVEAAGDKEDDVKTEVSACIKTLAKKYPNEVLQTICSYRKNHPKMALRHIAHLLQIAESVCRFSAQDIDKEATVTPLVELGISEMTKSQDLVPDWQLPASQLLVSMARWHCDQVMDGLLKHFQPGVLPHYFVLHSLGSLASANAFSMVPFIKACLGTMLPMMGALRTDALKQAFAYTLGRFADAIQEYLANLDQAPDSSVTPDVFNSELNVAIGVLINSWITGSKDQQLLENVLHAVAAVFPLLPPGRDCELAPRLLPLLLSLKRRTSGISGHVVSLPLPATRCLAAVLAQLCSDAAGSAALEPNLDSLLVALSDVIYEAPDLEQPLTIKNHYEALRCFDTLARRYPERLSLYLSMQLRVSNERDRARALVVLAHLVNCGHADRHLPDLAASVNSLLNDSSIKVKRAVVKVVVVLAHKGHLLGSEGAEFLLFIIKNCKHNISVGKTVEALGIIDPEELRQVCCDSLALLSSAAPQVAPLLRPLLLQCLVQSDFASVTGLLARCLNSITARNDAEDAHRPWELTPELKPPPPIEVLARCIVLLGSPLPERGVHILQFLQTDAPSVDDNIRHVFNECIPHLVKQLQLPIWDIYRWQESVLDLIRATVVANKDHVWVTGLAQALTHQGQQPLDSFERHIQLTSLGCLAANSGDSKMAIMLLQEALEAAKIYQDCAQACAAAIAECACGGEDIEGSKSSTQHLQLVVSQLRLTAKDIQSPQASASGSTASKLLPSFLSNIGSADRQRRGELAAGTERLRSAILLSYGELTKKAPGVELLPKLEPAGVVEWILQQLQATKLDSVRLAALKSLGQVAQAFHPGCNSTQVLLSCRQQALSCTMGQLTLGKPEVTTLALSVATSLIELPPTLDSDARMLILKSALDKVLDAIAEEDESSALLHSLERLCCAIMLSAGVTPASLDELMTLLEPWLQAHILAQRSAATSILASALTVYSAHLQFGFENPTSFSVASAVLAKVIPRCTDLGVVCRKNSVRCVRLALAVTARYEGRQFSDVEDELEKALGGGALAISMTSDDPTTLYQATSQLAMVICKHLPSSQLLGLVEGLVGALADPEPSSSAGTSVVLNTVLKEKGANFFQHTPDIIALIIHHLPQISYDRARTGVIHCVASLAHHHPKAVTLALLHQPLPYSQSVQSCWVVLAQERDLAGEVCTSLLSFLSSNALCEEPRDKASPRIALSTPLAAVSALHEMFISGAEPISEFASSVNVFPELLSVLILALAGLVGACPPVNMPGTRHRFSKSSSNSFVPNREAYNLVPGRVALNACSSLLTCAGCEAATEALTQCSHVETGESLSSFVDMVPLLIKSVVQCRPQIVPHFVTCLNQYANSSIDSARIAVVAVLSQLIQWPRAESVLLEGLVQQLTESLDDSCPTVRQLALQGLAHVSLMEAHQRERYTSSVLVALLQGLEDSPGEGLGLGLAKEALAGLAAILPHVEPKYALELQASLALRIRPFFTKESGAVRAAAFQTLGQLAMCGEKDDTKAAFKEQLSGSLVNLLLGLSDTEPMVIQSCKSTLRQIAPLLSAPKTAAMLQEHLLDEGTLQFSKFVTNLIKVVAEEMPNEMPYFIMTAMGFTRSQWPATRTSAALLIGLLCGNLPEAQAEHVALGSVCSRLTQLLTDPNPTVRCSATRAIGCVFVAINN